MSENQDVLDALRRRIHTIEGGPVEAQKRVGSGLSPLDAALGGGLPVPGIVEVQGALGSGRTRMAIRLVKARTERGELVVWVDPLQRLHPPTIHELGVDAHRLLIVRPPLHRLGWAVEQLAASGCFSLIVLSDPDGGDVRRAGARWSRAVRVGACSLVVLVERSQRGLPANVRTEVRGGEIEVRRNRGARAGAKVSVPAWPEQADPWR